VLEQMTITSGQVKLHFTSLEIPSKLPQIPPTSILFKSIPECISWSCLREDSSG